MSDFKAKIIKCTKFDFGWGSAPDPAGELSALPQTDLSMLLMTINMLYFSYEVKVGYREAQKKSGAQNFFRRFTPELCARICPSPTFNLLNSYAMCMKGWITLNL